MKRWIPWVAAAIVVVLVGGGAWRTMAARQAQHKAQAEATAQKAQAPLQLTADEVIAVRRQNLTLGVPVSELLGGNVRSLNADSDFKPFVGRAVAPDVRNAAMKKLFADPHFNVMDGLDIYIDDYSKPSPLPAELLRKMVSAQFLQMVEEEKPASGEPPGAPSAQAAPGEPGEVPTSQSAGLAEPVPAQPPALPDSPALGAEAVSTVSPPISAHDHPDLQLQPDHAPRRGGTEPGA